MKASKNTEEERESNKLKRQPSYEHLDSNFLHLTLPVVGTRYSRTTALDEERNNIAGDKDRCKTLAWDFENAVMGWRKNGKN